MHKGSLHAQHNFHSAQKWGHASFNQHILSNL